MGTFVGLVNLLGGQLDLNLSLSPTCIYVHVYACTGDYSDFVGGGGGLFDNDSLLHFLH